MGFLFGAFCEKLKGVDPSRLFVHTPSIRIPPHSELRTHDGDKYM